MARVWVTGLAGFTGLYLRDALAAAGHDVTGPTQSAQFDLLLPATLTAALAAAQPDYVIHLASLSFVEHADAAQIYAVNAIGSEHLLQAIATAAPNVRKIVLASSANVYGNGMAEVLEETVAPAPVNHYACSKLAMEYLARTWFDRLPIVITRPFNYTGPGQSEQFLVPKLVAHFVERRADIALGNLDVERDFSDVRMVADVYARLLAAPLVHQVVNVCSGATRSLRSLLAALESVCGYALPVRIAPELVRRAEIHRLAGSNRKLRDAIGALRYTDFDATLAWMVDAQGRQGKPGQRNDGGNDAPAFGSGAH